MFNWFTSAVIKDQRQDFMEHENKGSFKFLARILHDKAYHIWKTDYK